MKIRQYDIWLANLNPSRGTEVGKTRPVVVIQTNLLNDYHLSTLICPISTNVKHDIEILRVHLEPFQLEKESDIIVDQIRAVDNKRLLQKLGELSVNQKKKLRENLKVILDIS